MQHRPNHVVNSDGQLRRAPLGVGYAERYDTKNEDRSYYRI
ncbi:MULTISPECIES: hypothetical protein [unclassified Methylophaga]|nr:MULTISPECIES: hypothetical protein [unclassified Methylophaga]